jgi:hypothetical protein
MNIVDDFELDEDLVLQARAIRERHYRRRSRAAQSGRHLPTTTELLRGMPFLSGHVLTDAKAWAERLEVSLPAKVGNKVIKALQALTVPCSADTFLKTAQVLESTQGLHRYIDDTDAALRCRIYAAGLGSIDAARQIAQYTANRTYKRLDNEDEVRERMITAMMGWTIVAFDYQVAAETRLIRRDNLCVRALTIGEKLTQEIAQGQKTAAEVARFEERKSTKSKIAELVQSSNWNRISTAATPAGDTDKRERCLVIRELGGIENTQAGREAKKAFEEIVGKEIPLVPVPDLTAARRELLAEFPNACKAIDVLLSELVGRASVQFSPVLILGPAGIGKSRFSLRIFEVLGVPAHRYSCDGTSDNSFAGTPRRWSTGEASVPLELIRRRRIANPGVVLDEIEKAGGHRRGSGGYLHDALHGFLEPETAATYADSYLGAPANLSCVNYIAVANDVRGVPTTLLDRFHVVEYQRPSLDHLPMLAPRLLGDALKSRKMDPRWTEPLTAEELESIAGVWKGGSLRKLSRIISAVLDARTTRITRH